MTVCMSGESSIGVQKLDLQADLMISIWGEKNSVLPETCAEAFGCVR